MTAVHATTDAMGMASRPAVRRIEIADIFEVLNKGLDDFRQKPSHYVFIGLMYPIAGAVLIAWSIGIELVPMIYPLITGFALIGPILALGLYEISRRREAGQDTGWRHAFDVLRSPARLSLLAMSAYLAALFVAWLVAAQWLYFANFGELPPESLLRFVSDVLAQPNGWSLIFWGNFVGFLFALLALCTSIVAFPLLLDRDVGAMAAIDTSVRATLANPVPVLVWGMIVAAGLVVGMATLLTGLAVIVPILGHSTWHLYRKIVVPPVPERRSSPVHRQVVANPSWRDARGDA